MLREKIQVFKRKRLFPFLRKGKRIFPFLRKGKMLARFSIVVVTDAEYGISKTSETAGEYIPWSMTYADADRKFRRERTIGYEDGKNVVMYGRHTFENMMEGARLEKRQNVLISTTLEQKNYPMMSIYSDINSALATMGQMKRGIDKIYVIGGRTLFDEIISKYLYLCDEVIIKRYNKRYGCNRFFPFDVIEKLNRQGKCEMKRTASSTEYEIVEYRPNIEHPEMPFLKAIRSVLDTGETSAAAKVKDFVNFEIDLRRGLPVLTTQRVSPEEIKAQAVLLLKGVTDSKLYEGLGVTKFKLFASSESLKRRGLDYVEGLLGPTVPFQLRSFDSEYPDSSGGIDQLETALAELRLNPTSKKAFISFWNPKQVEKGVIVPNEISLQLRINASDELVGILNIRFIDLFVELPDTIGIYGVIMNILARILGKKAGSLYISIAAAQIAITYLPSADKLTNRTPYPWMDMIMTKTPDIPDEVTVDILKLGKYAHWTRIIPGAD